MCVFWRGEGGNGRGEWNRELNSFIDRGEGNAIGTWGLLEFSEWDERVVERIRIPSLVSGLDKVDVLTAMKPLCLLLRFNGLFGGRCCLDLELCTEDSDVQNVEFSVSREQGERKEKHGK